MMKKLLVVLLSLLATPALAQISFPGGVSDPGPGGSNGSVNIGIGNQIGYYASNGSTISGNANATVDVSGNVTALSLNGAKIVTLEEQAVSPKCVPDGTTDCLAAFNAAKASFSYTPFTTSGGEIRLNQGNYFFSAPMNVTGENGLTITGRGMLATTVSVGSGNYPVFTDLGTYTSVTNKITIRDMNISCGGKTNANAHGVQFKYSNTSYVTRNLFYGCKNAIDLTGVWQVHLEANRIDGLGSQQTETCLYMHSPTDVADVLGNNAVVASFNVCQNISLYGARLEDATGSIFVGNQWLNGVTGVYYCDPPIATFPCQFTFFNTDQVDTVTAQNWLFKKGLASAMGRGVVLNQPWAGSGVTAAFDIQGGSQIQIYNAEIQTNDIGFKITDTDHSTFTGHLVGINTHNNGSQAALLTSTTSNNVVRLEPIPASSFALVGYNGIVETGTFSNNQFWAGPAACALSLAFGGSSTGITYSSGPATANECQYEVKGMAVRLQFLMTLTAVPASGGAAATLTGLPFTAGPGGAGWAFGGISLIAAQAGFVGLTGPIIAQATAAGTTVGMLQQGATGYSNVLDSNFSASSNFVGTVEYMKQ